MGSMVVPYYSLASFFGSVRIPRQMIPFLLKDLQKRNPSDTARLGPDIIWAASRPELRKCKLIFG